MKTKRVLVTGGAGSIGSNLVEERAGNVYRMHEGTAHREFRELDLREGEGAHAHAYNDRWEKGV